LTVKAEPSDASPSIYWLSQQKRNRRTHCFRSLDFDGEGGIVERVAFDLLAFRAKTELSNASSSIYRLWRRRRNLWTRRFQPIVFDSEGWIIEHIAFDLLALTLKGLQFVEEHHCAQKFEGFFPVPQKIDRFFKKIISPETSF
jgi:hypothetical protein